MGTEELEENWDLKFEIFIFMGTKNILSVDGVRKRLVFGRGRMQLF